MLFSNFATYLVPMRRVLLTSFSVLIVLMVFPQAGVRNPLLIEGKIVDEKRNPVSYVNIYIKSSLKGTMGDYYGDYKIGAFPGDTITFSAVSFRKTSFIVPRDMDATAYALDVILEADTVGLKEVVIYPWPSTYKAFKEDFLELEVEDPIANLDLYLPSPKELKALSYTSGIPGQIRLYSGSGPVSLLYDAFSKEAKSRKAYGEVLRKEKADNRYNKIVVSQITGLKDDQEIREFMKFCALDVRFILDASDYELYLAIRNCYAEYAQLEMPRDSIIH